MNPLKIRYSHLPALLLCFLVMNSGAFAQEVCDLGSQEGLDKLLNDAGTLGQQPITATFSKPVLPAGQLVRLTASKSFSTWTLSRVCGVIIWHDDAANAGVDSCTPNTPSACTPIGTVAISGQPDDSTKTLLRFTVPADNTDNGWNRLRHSGTLYMAGYSDNESEPGFTLVQPVSVSGEAISKFWAFLFVGSIFAIVVFLAGKSARELSPHPSELSFASFLDPVKLTSGVDGKASISRLQFFGFSLIVAFLVLYNWARTGLLLELSSDLLLLMGISGGGAAGAKVTAVVKKRLSPIPRIYLENKGWTSTRGAAGARGAKFRDLVLTDGKLNVYKFQMAVFSLIVAFVLISSGVSETGVVVIPDIYLGLLGLGQGVYIAGKGVSESDAADYENIFVEMKDKEKAYLQAQESAAHIADVPEKDAFHESNLSYQSWTPSDPAVAQAYQEYIEQAEIARTAFQTLYDVPVSDEKLLPRWKSWCNTP